MNKSPKGKANSPKDDAKEISAILFDQSHVAIFILDPQQRLMDLNLVGSALLGYDRDEFLKLTFSDLLHPETRGKIDLNGLETGGTLKNQCQLRHKDGTYLSLTMDVRRLSSQNFLATVYDDSAIGLNQNRADQDQRNLERIVDQSPAVAFLWHAEAGWPVKYVSDSIRQFGYSPQDLYSGRVQFASIIHPDDLERVSDEVRNYSQIGRTEFTQEYRILTADGKTRWVDDRTWVLRDADGRVVHYQGIILDITEHKVAAQALKESEEKFRSIVENSLAGIFMVNEAYQFVYANDELCRILGYPRDELIGLDLKNVFSENSRALLTDRYIRRQRGEDVPNRYELDVLRCDGEVRDAEMIVTVVKDTSGRNNTMGQLVDITERKQVEKELRQFKVTLDKTSDCVFVFEPTTLKFYYVNQGAVNQLGYTEAELLQMHSYDIKPEFPEPKFRSLILPLLEGIRSEFLFETVHRHKDGHDIPVEISLQYVAPIGEDGRFIAIVRDVTQRRQIEEALRESLIRQTAILNNIPDMAWLKDKESCFIAVNEPFGQACGLAPADVVGKTDLDIWPEELAQGYLSDDSAVMISGKRKQVEERLVDSNGKESWIETVKTPIFDTNGGVVGTAGIARDITDRRQMSNALQESRNLLMTVLDAAPIRFFWKDLNLRYLGCNQPFASDAGLTSPEEIIGKDDYQMGWQDQADLYRNDDKRVIKSGTPKFNYEEPQTTPDGRTIWLRTSKVPLKDGEGNIRGVLGTYEDITERKQAEEALRRTRFTVEHVSDAIQWIDQNGQIVDVNEAACHMLGYTRDELTQMKVLDIDATPLFDVQLGFVDQLRKTGTATFETRHRAKDGRLVPVEIVANMITFGDEEFNCCFVRDITERKRSESLLHLRLRLFEYATDHSLGELLQKILDELGDLTESPIGFYHFVDADERTLSLQAWSSRTLKEFCKADGSGMHYSIDEAGVWVDCVRKRQPVVHNDYASLPHRKGLPEGHAHLVRELVVPVFRNGRIVAILGVGNKQQDYIDQDVEFVSYVADLAWELAERKRTDEEREILITELEAKNSELERFTYTVSHDLKAPLVTIKGFLGFLKQDIASGNVERVNNNIERIGNAAVKMEQLLKDLLELSRIGRMVNPSEEIPFDDLIREALEIVHGQLDDRGITIHAQPNLPVIYGDRLRLVEVLQNLLDNAAKYMGDQTNPHIEIGQRGEENAMPEFFVKDNGIGIDPEYHERIFGLFNKLDVGSEGTGVGLALVKRIVEFHGGRIWVESEAGKGSTFLFTLRTKPTA